MSYDHITTPMTPTRALVELEQTTLMSRGLREFLLVSMQDLAMRQSVDMQAAGVDISAQEILAVNSAWVKLNAINAQCISLRKAME